jgi:hypothetical protein
MGLEARQALAFRIALLLLCALAAGVFSALIPLLWHDKLYIDGLTILRTQPRMEWFGSSYGSAAYLLSPLLGLLRALGVRLDDYGLQYSEDLLIANGLFGLLFLLGIASFALRWRLRTEAGNAVVFTAFVVLFAPFYFCITKEVVPFAMAAAALWGYRAGLLGVRGAAWSYALLLVGCGMFFRTYYLAYAALFVLNLWGWRRQGWLLAGYLAGAALLVLLHDRLPLDLLAKGRAAYLENVAASRIPYYFDDVGAFGFLANRVVTLAMLLLPLNLLAVSLSYAPFVAIQLLLSWRTWRALRRPTGAMHAMAGAAVLAFTAVSALYEPDFGSYFRHKVGILLFMLILVADFEWIAPERCR